MEEMVGTFIKIYVRENERCKELGNKPLNKVIAQIAIELGIYDFAELKAMEGYLFDKKMHSAMKEVVEPALPIIIDIFTTNELANRFLEAVKPYSKNSVILVFKDVKAYLFR